MGVSGVWGLLDSERGGCAATVLSARDKQLGKVYAELDGAVVAIDLGLLVVKALTQPNQYESGLDPRGAVLKRVYENCVALLRAGAVPVGVTDGKPPEAKLERMSQRQGGTGYRWSSTSPFQRSLADAQAVMAALGLHCFKAPGEAEALCAQLCAVGAVGAVHSADSDALVYGAKRLYRTLKVTTAHRDCELKRIDLRTVRTWLGITEGEIDEALEAMWVLCGCDYLLDGAEHLGARGVAKLLRHLLQSTPTGGRTAVGLTQRLRARMAQPGEAHEAALLLQDVGCTGCKTCGHEKHGRRACPHPDCAEEVEDGMRCMAKGEGVECSCPFHASATDRFIARSLEKARTTGGFLPAFDKAVAAFRTERARARDAALAAQRSAGGGLLSWRHRPNVAALASLLGPAVHWTPDDVHRKTLPCLLLWDASHPGAPECVLRPSAVLRESTVDKELGVPSYYAFKVEWEAAQGGGAEVERCLAIMAVKKDLCVLRGSLLREHATELLATFENARAAKAAAAEAKAARAAAKAEAKERAAKGQTNISSYFPIKHKPGLSGSSSQEKSDSGGAAEEEAGPTDSDCDGSQSSDVPPGWRGPSSPAKRGSPLPAAGAAAADPDACHSTPPKKARPDIGSPARTPLAAQSDIKRFLFGAAAATPLTVPPPAVAAAPVAAVPRPPRNRSLWTASGEGGAFAAGDSFTIDLTFSPEASQLDASQRTPQGVELPPSQDDVIILS